MTTSIIAVILGFTMEVVTVEKMVTVLMAVTGTRVAMVTMMILYW